MALPLVLMLRHCVFRDAVKTPEKPLVVLINLNDWKWDPGNKEQPIRHIFQ